MIGSGFETPRYWNERHSGGNWGKDKPPSPRVVAFLEKYRDEIGPKVLDIASGDGRHLIKIAEMGHVPIGLDFSSTGLNVARKKLDERKFTYALHLHDFHRPLPFDSGSMDAALMVSAFNRNDWKGAKETFREITRILKPGRLFFLRVRSDSVPVEKPGQKADIVNEPFDFDLPIDNRGVTYIKEEDGRKFTAHAFSLEELTKLGEKFGMEIIEEPVDEKEIDEKGNVVKGQWNITYRKRKKVA